VLPDGKPWGHGSIIFGHECAPCIGSGYHWGCRGCWRGVLCKGFGPDGKLPIGAHWDDNHAEFTQSNAAPQSGVPGNGASGNGSAAVAKPKKQTAGKK
jgi:hypothetical protein